MTNDEKIIYLNRLITNKDKFKYDGPDLLYKYRSFDEFTFDMLEKEYVYLCPAKDEDDETECITTADFDRLVNLDSDGVKKECVNQIIEMIRPYSNKDTFDKVKSRIISMIGENEDLPANAILEISNELQELVPLGLDINPILEWIIAVPELINKQEISEKIKSLFLVAYNARTEIGICSFAESNDINYMWEKYTKESSGYCIEYDVSNYEYNNSILPVIYQDERETNIIMQLVGSFIGQMITDFSSGQIQADSSHFVRLFLTKYKKWEYQKEWRLIGKANDKMKAPIIKCIYLGSNVKEENASALLQFAKKHNIKIVYM